MRILLPIFALLALWALPAVADDFWDDDDVIRPREEREQAPDQDATEEESTETADNGAEERGETEPEKDSGAENEPDEPSAKQDGEGTDAEPAEEAADTSSGNADESDLIDPYFGSFAEDILEADQHERAGGEQPASAITGARRMHETLDKARVDDAELTLLSEPEAAARGSVELETPEADIAPAVDSSTVVLLPEEIVLDAAAAVDDAEPAIGLLPDSTTLSNPADSTSDTHAEHPAQLDFLDSDAPLSLLADDLEPASSLKPEAASSPDPAEVFLPLVPEAKPPLVDDPLLERGLTRSDLVDPPATLPDETHDAVSMETAPLSLLPTSESELPVEMEIGRPETELPLIHLPELPELPQAEEVESDSEESEQSPEDPAAAVDPIDIPLIDPPTHSLQPPPPPSGLERYSTYPHMQGKVKPESSARNSESEEEADEEIEVTDAEDETETEQEPRVNDDDPEDW